MGVIDFTERRRLMFELRIARAEFDIAFASYQLGAITSGELSPARGRLNDAIEALDRARRVA